jgi:hypothetical protein
MRSKMFKDRRDPWTKRSSGLTNAKCKKFRIRASGFWQGTIKKDGQ